MAHFNVVGACCAKCLATSWPVNPVAPRTMMLNSLESTMALRMRSIKLDRE